MITSILRAGLVAAAVFAAAGGYATSASVAGRSGDVLLAQQNLKQQCLTGCINKNAACKASCAENPGAHQEDCNSSCEASKTLCIEQCSPPAG